jgi:hypothetical protein
MVVVPVGTTHVWDARGLTAVADAIAGCPSGEYAEQSFGVEPKDLGRYTDVVPKQEHLEGHKGPVVIFHPTGHYADPYWLFVRGWFMVECGSGEEARQEGTLMIRLPLGRQCTGALTAIVKP